LFTLKRDVGGISACEDLVITVWLTTTNMLYQYADPD